MLERGAAAAGARVVIRDAEGRRVADTVVMRNLGYFQVAVAKAGVYAIEVGGR